MKIQQVVVMYLHDHQIRRPPSPPIVSPRYARVCVAEDTDPSPVRVAESVVRELEKAKLF
jgi:hypothetical protein